MEEFGTKDLYKVAIRATHNMKIGNRTVVAGEPVLYLDGAQMFAMGQNTSYRAARGGKGNFAQVVWENHGDVNFAIQRGTVSPLGLALLTNLSLMESPEDGTTVLTHTEIVEIDDYGKAYLKHKPLMDKPLFIYRYKNKVIQEQVETYGVTNDLLDVGVDSAGDVVLVDYSYNYGEPVREYLLGQNRFNGTLSMEARYYTKGESGLESSNIIYVPKIRIISDINLRIGDNVAAPTLSTFSIVAMAEKVNGEITVMRMLQLGEDVDSM